MIRNRDVTSFKSLNYMSLSDMKADASLFHLQ